MHRSLHNLILIASPAVLTIALCMLAFAVHTVGRGFGSTRGSGPILAALAVVWLLHAGYILGPWLYEHQREWLALVLMVPVAVVGVCGVLFIAGNLILENTAAMNGRFGLYCIAWACASLAGYLGPIAIMLVCRQPRSA